MQHFIGRRLRRLFREHYASKHRYIIPQKYCTSSCIYGQAFKDLVAAYIVIYPNQVEAALQQLNATLTPTPPCPAVPKVTSTSRIILPSSLVSKVSVVLAGLFI